MKYSGLFRIFHYYTYSSFMSKNGDEGARGLGARGPAGLRLVTGVLPRNGALEAGVAT